METEMKDKTTLGDEHKKNIAKGLKGSVKTDEHKAKIAEGMRKRWAERKAAKLAAAATPKQPGR
jgi:hypothetical protein